MQISRLFEITYLLLERGTMTARDLAERFEVSMRTIYRDVEHLSSSGVPVYMAKGRNGGIHLLPDFVLDKTVLTQREKDEILSALSGLSATGRAEAGNALQKLAALFGSTGSGWIEVDYTGWGWSGEVKASFERVKDAIQSRHVLAFTYYSGEGEKTYRVAEPMKLVFRGQSWYLYGWCRNRGECRFFKLSRMEGITILDAVFERQAPRSVLEQEKPLMGLEMATVTFLADEAVSYRIYDEYPHTCIRPEAEGKLLVSAAMPHGEWLASYFLSYGRHIEILEPDTLRQEIRDSLKAMLEKYH